MINVNDTVLIGGDGSVFRREPARNASTLTRVAPEPPPDAFTIAHISAHGMAQLYDLADQLGLFDDDATLSDDVEWHPDEGATAVSLDRGAGPVTHYRPNHYDESVQPDYFCRVEKFTDAALDLESFLNDDDLSDPAPYVPEQWLISYAQPDLVGGVPQWPLATEPKENSCVALPTSAGRDLKTGNAGITTSWQNRVDDWLDPNSTTEIRPSPLSPIPFPE